MTGNGHAAYFSQAVISEGEGTQNKNNLSQSDFTGTTNISSQTILTGVAGGQSTASSTPRSRGQDPTLATDLENPVAAGVFRASLVSKMDGLIQDFQTNKISRSETLYQIQILQSLHDAGLEEPVR